MCITSGLHNVENALKMRKQGKLRVYFLLYEIVSIACQTTILIVSFHKILRENPAAQKRQKPVLKMPDHHHHVQWLHSSIESDHDYMNIDTHINTVDKILFDHIISLGQGGLHAPPVVRSVSGHC